MNNTMKKEIPPIVRKLIFPNGNTVQYTTDTEIVLKIKNMKTLKEKIEFYNKNICSLIFCPYQGKLRLRNPNYSENLTIFWWGAKGEDGKEIFTEADLIDYLSVRKEEVLRVCGELAKCKDYKAKLRYYISILGFNDSFNPTIEGFDEKKSSKDHPEVTCLEVDLNPKVEGDFEIYNTLLTEFYTKKYKPNGKFVDDRLFDSNREKRNFSAQLSNAIEPQDTLEREIVSIKQYYQYNGMKNENFPSALPSEIEFFANKLNGIDNKPKHKIVDDFFWRRKTHIDEVVQYYIYLKDELEKLKLSNKSMGEGSSSRKPDKKEKKTYSHKEIAIAYHIIRKQITIQNASKILKKYSHNKSAGRLVIEYNNIKNTSQLSVASEQPTTNGKHLKALKGAERLIRSKKNTGASKLIKQTITAFATDRQKKE